MRNILRAKFYRLKNSTSINTFLIISIFVAIYILSQFNSNYFSVSFLEPFELGFKYIYPIYFAIIFSTSSSITEDFLEGTHKNYISKGFSRTSYYFSSLIIELINATLIFFIYFFVLVLGFYIFINIGYYPNLENIKIIISKFFILLLFGYFYVCLISAIGFLSLNIVKTTFISALIFILNVYFLDYYKDTNNIFAKTLKLSPYYLITQLGKSSYSPTGSEFSVLIFLPLCGILISILVSLIFFRQKDLN